MKYCFYPVTFSATKKIGNFIQFDDVNKKIAIPKTSFTGKICDLHIFDYSAIAEYELLEDGNSIEKGGIGRALVGGALFGGAGAVVGASTGHKHKATCSKLQIKITLNDMKTPVVYVNFIEAETKKNGALYKMIYPIFILIDNQDAERRIAKGERKALCSPPQRRNLLAANMNMI